eukprot:5556263-Pyramimonas_sp.AAC.1
MSCFTVQRHALGSGLNDCTSVHQCREFPSSQPGTACSMALDSSCLCTRLTCEPGVEQFETSGGSKKSQSVNR